MDYFLNSGIINVSIETGVIMPFKIDPNILVEKVIFNGHTYNRYPNSKNRTHRTYFTRSGGFSLHRAIWESHNGPIPQGFHVHHADGNPLNNDISNLCCISPKDHAIEHAEERSANGKTEEQTAHLSRIRRLASDWHKSAEGRAWHKENAKTSIPLAIAAKGPAKERECKCHECGAVFVSKSHRSKYCSEPCRNERNQRQKNAKNLESRTGYACLNCNGSYVATKKFQK
jgi:hypothetical protein